METTGLPPTGEDAEAVMKVETNPPVGGTNINHFLRVEVVAKLLLPPGHTFLQHITAHNQAYRPFHDNKWAHLQLSTPQRTGARGILMLQAWSLRWSVFWEQKGSEINTPLPKPTWIWD